MDDEEFTRFLVARGYDREAARALIGQVYDDEIGGDGFLDIEGQDSLVVIEIDASMGFAGILRFKIFG